MTNKFICYHCKQTFDEPKLIREPRGEYWGVPCTEDVYVCPYCGDDDFKEDDTND